jgi:hypothetical protein
MTDSGSGNFGGSNLGSDPGGASPITISTGSATLTVKKANYNVIDSAVVGSSTLVSSGTSQGLVIWGPNPTATYPASVTCGTGAGQSPCTNLFTSANDATSTTVLEENGPAMAVTKTTGNLNDGAGHVYMHYTTRMYFVKGQSYVKVTTILRNADYGGPGVFASAFKGHQGFEMRVKFANPSAATTLNYTIANHTATPSTGTLNVSGGTDNAYIYQAENIAMNAAGWCAGNSDEQCITPSSLNGYAVLKNGASQITGTNLQSPGGWADVSDSSGNGIEIGKYQMGPFANASLEFQGGGTDVRIGLVSHWNNNTGLTSANADHPYCMPWPQYAINDAYMDFHTSLPSPLANPFLSYQHYLVGRVSVSYINATGVLFYPLLPAAQEDQFYNCITGTGPCSGLPAGVTSTAPASPSITARPIQDLGIADTYNWPLTSWRFYPWHAGGASNQSEFRLSQLLNFLRRGFTGSYLDSSHFYKMMAELSFPRADGGYSWRTQSDTQYMAYPSTIFTNASTNEPLGTIDYIEPDQEHAHWTGILYYYLLSGDETMKDAILDGVKSHYLNTVSSNNLISAGQLWVSRAVGTVLMGTARLSDFLQSIGDSDAATVLARGALAWTQQIKPDLCVSGYPVGCTLSQRGGDTTPYGRGTSKVRGISFQWADTSFDPTGCTPFTDRTSAVFMDGIMAQGMWELRLMEGSGWADYNPIFDTLYGIYQQAVGEMYVDNNSASFSGNGFRYKQSLDFANGCATSGDYVVKNPDAFWPLYFAAYYYTGQGPVGWIRKFTQNVESVFPGSTPDSMAELYQDKIANVINLVLNNPSTTTLSTQTLTGFTANGGGSYTLQWTVPTGATSYRIKYSINAIVDYIGFNSSTNAFIGNPATTANWWASTDAPSIPTPGTPGTTQSYTATGLPNGLSQGNFMVKAYASATGLPATGTRLLGVRAQGVGAH